MKPRELLRGLAIVAATGTLLTVCALAVYVWRFGANGISSRPELWGQMGDYLGGVLGPPLSLLALLAILFTIYLQSEELEKLGLQFDEMKERDWFARQPLLHLKFRRKGHAGEQLADLEVVKNQAWHLRIIEAGSISARIQDGVVEFLFAEEVGQNQLTVIFDEVAKSHQYSVLAYMDRNREFGSIDLRAMRRPDGVHLVPQPPRRPTPEEMVEIKKNIEERSGGGSAGIPPKKGPHS